MLRPAPLGLCSAAAPLGARCHNLRYKLRLFRALRAHEAISCLERKIGQQLGMCPTCARAASMHALHVWMVLQNLNTEFHCTPLSEHTQCNHTCNPSRQCGWYSLTTCQLSRENNLDSLYCFCYPVVWYGEQTWTTGGPPTPSAHSQHRVTELRQRFRRMGAHT